MFLEIVAVVVIDLIAVAVSLMDRLSAVQGISSALLIQDTGIGTESQGAADILHTVLIWHQKDHRMGGGGIQLRTVGVVPPDHIPGKFHDGKLHAKAETKEWDIVLAGIADGKDFAVDAPVAESSGNEDTADILKCFGGIFLCYLFGIHPFDIDLCAEI